MKSLFRRRGKHECLPCEAQLCVAGRQDPPALAGALCRALCLINAMRSAGDKPIASESEQLTSARILCLTASPDEPSQYMALMNSIFAAQAGLASCLYGWLVSLCSTQPA